TYRPIDVFGAEGDPVAVTVEIADEGAANRPPIVQSEAVRVRRDVQVPVAVLANDRDPDGDKLSVEIVSVAPGIVARVTGDDIALTAQAGATNRSWVDYVVSDGRGGEGEGRLLVIVVGAEEPNRAPVANADSATAVVGTTVAVDVLRNDVDPDGDVLVLLDAAPGQRSTGSVRVQDDRVLYTPGAVPDEGERVDDKSTY